MSAESLNNNENEQLNPSYDEWREAMEDVEFQGGKDEVLDATEKAEQVKSREDIKEIIRDISQKEIERSREQLIRPRAEIICDHDHIDGQRIDVISKADQGKLEFSLKLRTFTEEVSSIAAQLEGATDKTRIVTPDGATLRKGEIEYTFVEGGSIKLCNAYVLEKEKAKVLIADDRRPVGRVRTAIGLVKVEMPIDMNPEDMEKELNDVLENDLGIPGALNEVSGESEKEYKTARYKWEHKLSGELTPEQEAEIGKMQREEVFPGYTTFVEKGKHKEYLEKYGEDIRAVHTIYALGKDIEAVYQLLSCGLFSSTERFNRGVPVDGWSSREDLNSGGADSVFTRLKGKEEREGKMDLQIVFKPEIFDRTDWYAYEWDESGSTEDDVFETRLSPDELFALRDSSGFPSMNEQMFKTGIGPDYIESVQTDSYFSRENLVEELKSMGLTEVGGRPIEEIIVSRFGDPSIKEMVEFAKEGTDFYAVLKTKIEAEMARGRKEELKDGMADYIKETTSVADLKTIAKGGIIYKLKTKQEDKDFHAYLRETLGIDYQKIYEDALKSRQKSKEKK